MAMVAMAAGAGHIPPAQASCLPQPVTPCATYCYSPSLIPAPPLPPASPPSQGTTYQKTDATVEMKRLNREQFWEQAKVGYGEGSRWPPGSGVSCRWADGQPHPSPPPSTRKRRNYVRRRSGKRP